ncbi:hypothetical protein [Bdellovibrio sp. HCB274]|uniref:hypothetical protein n=1 Tax=Bdellovibrio sp. HCB274 TaxID=3394361 RepID=UPI0039B51E48
MKYILFFVLTLTGFVSFAADDTSFGTRGGGNGSAAEFHELADDLFENLIPESPFFYLGQPIDLVALKEMFKSTVITVVDTGLRLNGSIVDVINYPQENRLELNSRTWTFLAKDKRRQIVLHELLGLASIPDPGYAVSKALFKRDQKIRSLKYNESCTEARYVTGMDAFTMYFLMQNRNDKSISPTSVENLQCSSEPWKKATTCKSQFPNPIDSNAESEVLLSLLRKLGVEMTSPNGIAEIYFIKSLVCIPSDYLYQCIVIAKWQNGCANSAF